MKAGAGQHSTARGCCIDSKYKGRHDLESDRRENNPGSMNQTQQPRRRKVPPRRISRKNRTVHGMNFDQCRTTFCRYIRPSSAVRVLEDNTWRRQ